MTTPAQQAPSPPVVADKKVDSAKQSCPLKAKKQCELTKLKVQSKYVSSEAGSSPVVTTLEAKKKRRGEAIPPAAAKKVGRKTVELLAQYDLVIEALAGFPSKANEEGGVAKETKGVANMAEIEVETELLGQCGYSKHARLLMKPANAPPNKVNVSPAPVRGSGHMALVEAEWAAGVKKAALKEIVAPTFKADIAGGDNAFAQLFRLIMWVWNANKSLDLELRAESCGIHSATEMGTHDLNALVRVYRDVNVAIGIKVPAVKKVTESSDRRIGIGTDTTTRKRESTNLLTERKSTVTTTTTKTGFKGTAVFEHADPDEFAFYVKFNELEFMLRETRDKVKEQAEAYKKAAENAHEKYKGWRDERARKAAIDRAIREALSDFLTLRDKLELFWEGFVAKVRAVINAIRAALDAMKKWPQLGFKLTFEIGFLSGDLFFGWGHAALDSSQAYNGPLKDRYAPLLHKIHVESKITLVTFKVEASFGLMIDAGAVGKAEARVAGSLSLEIAWTTALDLVLGAGSSYAKDADSVSQVLAGTSTGNLRATVEARIAFFSFKKEIGIESGIVVEGKVEWKFLKGEITYGLKIRSLETGWYFYSTDLKTGQANVSVHKIFDARMLMPPIERTERI
jgi:hypothetical protein